MTAVDQASGDAFPLGAADVDLPLHEALRAVALEVGDRATRTLRASEANEPSTVHALRVATKRLRSFWQLHRGGPNAELARSASRTLRDAARSLATERDDWVRRSLLLELEAFAEPVDAGDFSAALRHLASPESSVASGSSPSRDERDDFFEALASDRRAWSDATSIEEAVLLDTGLHRAFRKTAKLAAAALADLDPGRLHRWRRWIKYLRYQLEPLARPERPAILELHDEAKLIGSLLGRHHDLFQLRLALASGVFPAVITAIDERSRQLEAGLPALHETLFALPADRLVAAVRHDLSSQSA